jgi:hypothetical protein
MAEAIASAFLIGKFSSIRAYRAVTSEIASQFPFSLLD